VNLFATYFDCHRWVALQQQRPEAFFVAGAFRRLAVLHCEMPFLAFGILNRKHRGSCNRTLASAAATVLIFLVFCGAGDYVGCVRKFRKNSTSLAISPSHKSFSMVAASFALLWRIDRVRPTVYEA
jgi:hypothetical protein